MLEDSDSEPSESEPLVQPALPDKRDTSVWKSNSTKSTSSSGAASGTTAKTNPKTNPKATVRTDAKHGQRRVVPAVDSTRIGVTNPPATNRGSGSGILTRGSSKRLHDLVASPLEKVPENDEANASSNGTRVKDSATGTDILTFPSEPSSAMDQGSPDEQPQSLVCPFFGVRNYLHHFYDKPQVKDPSLYEDILPCSSDEGVFLVKNSSHSCSSPVFRLSVILGGLIFMMGAIALLIAACSTKRSPLVAKVGGVSVIDRQAATHNAEVDALILVGMVAILLGSSVLTAAILSRAFCPHPSESRPFRIRLLGDEYPVAVNDALVPATEQLTAVQPSWESPPSTSAGERNGYTSVKGVLMMP